MMIPHDREAFLRSYKRTLLWVFGLTFVLGSLPGFCMGPFSDAGLFMRVANPLSNGCLLSSVATTIAGACFQYIVLGRDTMAVYYPLSKRRVFMRREHFTGYRPKTKVLVSQGLPINLAPGRVPWRGSVLDVSARVLNVWWPNLDSRAIQSEAISYESWSGAGILVVVAMLGIVMFVAALVFLAGGFAVRVGVVIGLVALALLGWLMEWHRRRCFEVALPGRDAG